MSRQRSLWDQLSPEARALRFLLHAGSLAVVVCAYALAFLAGDPTAFVFGALAVVALALLLAIENYVRARRPR